MNTACCGCGESGKFYDAVYGEYWCQECLDALPESDKEDIELTETDL